MKKIEHVGIAVNDLEKANEVYRKILGVSHYKIEEVASEGVLTSFFKTADSKVELLQATHKQGPIAKFVEQRGEGIHHIAFLVTDIYKEIIRLKKEGFDIIDDSPKKGADNKLVAFVHPKSCNGVLIELCQEIKNDD
ncbi:methylmalonyl-CoA epimerase [Euzebyella saccharophila]|uniref:Methylmalonyl-CoA epimerase n=1 Tax=Euzebyella saccharophila TaxID=679664 RepID=A0ABV8JRR6_9FLAO|nr:methylmalonyl-CoA epimerase [Euzebyella saccharophila]